MLRERYESGLTMNAFVDGARANAELWRSIHRRARAPGELVARAAELPAERHLLVLLEDWCGDAVNTVPVLARLAEVAPRLDLRVLPRDENPDLMDAHLTGASRSIPVVIVLDESYAELGWWGPRPAELQAWVVSEEARRLSKEERYREVRRWYARDRGRSTLTEILDLLERTAAARAA
ncbi:MAG TPA: thioredoxin family protein [Longimicrobiaceae bacterium]